jgi:flagellar basal-body rod modification protein FlgD
VTASDRIFIHMSAASLSPLLTGSSTTSSVASDQLASTTNNSLTANDFIGLLITELQNQDPTQPMSNTDLLTQLSQIGQLESTDQMQTTLQGITLQSSIGSAGNLIGKQIQGIDDEKNNVTGIVTGVQVQNQQVYLALDSGDSVQMGNVSQISPAPGSSSGSGTSLPTSGSSSTSSAAGSTSTTGATSSTGTSSTTTPSISNAASAAAAAQNLLGGQ